MPTNQPSACLPGLEGKARETPQVATLPTPPEEVVKPEEAKEVMKQEEAVKAEKTGGSCSSDNSSLDTGPPFQASSPCGACPPQFRG